MHKFKKKIQGWGTRWLNMAWKSILIKSVLLTLPIFFGSRLLDPKSVLSQMSALTRRILWQGGKDNKNNFHLLMWNIVYFLKEFGGLGIKDHMYTNLTSGATIVWKLILDSIVWWKEAFIKKYFHKNRILRVDKVRWEGKGLKIWSLCNFFSPVII